MNFFSMLHIFFISLVLAAGNIYSQCPCETASCNFEVEYDKAGNPQLCRSAPCCPHVKIVVPCERYLDPIPVVCIPWGPVFTNPCVYSAPCVPNTQCH